MNLTNVSVVVCAFNEEKFLLRCLNSIKSNINNLDKSAEIIIVDNSSFDSTGNIALKFVNENTKDLMIRYLKIAHVPLTSSRNTAISYCKGRFIVFVDADAVVDNDWLENILSEFNENTPIVAGNIANLNSKSYFSDFIYNSHYKCSLESNRLIGANMAFKHSVFESDNGFLSATGNRGDETLFLQEYVKNNPDMEIGFAKNSIVYNDFPNSLKEWLIQQYIGGREYLKISKFNNQSFINFLQEILRVINVFFLPHLFIHFFIISSPLFVFHLALFLLRNIYKVKHFYCGFKNLYNQRKLLLSIFYFPVTLFGALATDMGYVFQAFISFNKEIDKGQANISKVLHEVKSIKLID